MTAREPIYVIYRPLPATLLTLVLAFVGGLLGLVLGSAAAAALGQRDPGPGVWDTSNTSTITGTIVADPYPMLMPEDGSAGVLLVGVGKVGPPQVASDLAGMHARVTGYPLEREGMRMLEVQSAESIDRASVLDRQRAREIGRYDIETEILDAKCFIGAMKPGDGLGHKACATLCIAGGIPPMARWVDSAGRTHYALLTDASGGPLPSGFHAQIGEPVSVAGDLNSRHGWLWLAVETVEKR